ncbi:MAG: M6 family metalloprotease domain-containing protein [Muribaculum sp.]|nr:M6 family metalloprotease domain-containing protein [Muribaculaceae bacterium]MCM1080751.1 M6 family metalloprotease domain-containing protein [Muribaculum sp.]
MDHNINSLFGAMKKFLLAVSIALLANSDALAVMATPDPVVYTNPDGSKVTIKMFGDEHFSFNTTTDGYVVKAAPDGTLYYMESVNGKLAMSAVAVSDIASRSDAETSFLASLDKEVVMQQTRATMATTRAASNSAIQYAPINEKKGGFPTMGSPKVLIIMAEYSDVKFQSGAKQQITNMLSQKGYSANGGTGSALDYYTDSSNGQFTPQFDVYGPVTLSNTRAYYGAETETDNDVRAPEMIAEACRLLDDEINYADYDCDHDGQIDNIFLFYAGQGQADSGIGETIWPHAWYLSGHSCHFYADGILLNRYATTAELNTSGGLKPTGIGTFVHEFSHVMGLPDLYDTAYNGSNDPGQFSLMASGNYLNRQNTPPMFSAYERAVMGWLDPFELTDPRNVALAPSTSADGYEDAAIIKTPSNNEYYVLETRKKTGWDAYIPAEGMLIWHIDYNASVWSQNRVNATPSHQRIDIVESNPKSPSNDGVPFPGYTNNRSFADDTNPSITPWTGVALNKRLDQITRFDDGTVSFRFNGGAETPSKLKLNEPSQITHTTATISWQPVQGVKTYYVSLWNDEELILNEQATEKTSYSFEGLTQLTTYSYRVGYYDDRFIANVESSFETAISPIDTRRPVANEATNIGPTSALLSWEEMIGAKTYTVSVFTGIEAGPKTETATFDNSSLPDDWTTNATAFATASGYYGSKAPALQIYNKEFVQTPAFDSNITNIAFTARRIGTAQSSLIVEGRITPTSPWKQIVSEEIPRNKTKKSYDQSIIADGYTQIRIRLEAEDNVSVTIDDIAITIAESYALTPYEGMVNLDADSNLRYTVKGLMPETEYYFTVVGHDGTLDSKESKPVKFTTIEGATSAIDEVAQEREITLQGHQLSVAAPAGTSIAVITTDGRIIAQAQTSLAAQLPAPGLYIIKVGATASKLICK